MKLIENQLDKSKTLPSINKLLETINYKTYPIIFFIDIDNTILITMETSIISQNYNIFSNIKPIKSILNFFLIDDAINDIDIEIIDIEVIDNYKLIYDIIIRNKDVLIKLRIKFRHDLYNFFVNLKKITPYVGLFTAGNYEYAAMIYKILHSFYNIQLSFFFSVNDISPDLYQIKLDINQEIYYNGKDLHKVLSILQKKLIIKRKPIFNIPILIDDKPTWCLNGWIIPIEKLDYNIFHQNFDEIYEKEIIYSTISIKK